MNTHANNSSNYRLTHRFVVQFKISQAILAKWVFQNFSPAEDSKVSLTIDSSNGNLADSYRGIEVALFLTISKNPANLRWNQHMWRKRATWISLYHELKFRSWQLMHNLSIMYY